MSFAERVERQQEVVFRTFGEDARWNDGADSVRVRLTARDDVVGFGDGGQAIVFVTVIRVRKSEVAEPKKEDRCVTIKGRGFTISGVPIIDRKGVWTCPVTEDPTP